MKVLFRTDASLELGAGHVMRCLTLATFMKSQDIVSEFICRADKGHLLDLIRRKGFVTHVLERRDRTEKIENKNRLNSTNKQTNPFNISETSDAYACRPILEIFRPDWLIVDHYAIGARWHTELADMCSKLMVIDDLANRFHACDILLDQTFGRTKKDYFDRVPEQCRLLCGSRYALLRPEFAKLRDYSLTRRQKPSLKNLLISMGGIDKDNVTTEILGALKKSTLPYNCCITVVMGAKSPWIEKVKTTAQKLNWQTEILVAVDDMATLFAESDLAIGAVGGTSLERCCLGLPTIATVIADNQRQAASFLSRGNAVKIINCGQNMQKELCEVLNKILMAPHVLSELSQSCSKVTDGFGCKRVLEKMTHEGL